MTQRMTQFVDELPPDADSKISAAIRKAILKRTCGVKGQGKPNVVINSKNWPEPILKSKKKPESGPPSIFDFDEMEVARQICLIEFETYERIQPSELLNLNWSKDKTKHLAGNVLKMSGRSTDISNWIVELILEPARVKVRTERLARLIKLAGHLRDLNNYSALMALLGGFNNACISRLKFTREGLSKKNKELLETLEKLMSVESSSKNYRESLRSHPLPGIPYMGTHLSDLTFIEEGNPSEINGLINMFKRTLTFRVISELQRFQFTKYQFKPVSQIQNLFSDLPKKDDKKFNNEMFEKSLSREPRGASQVQ